MQNYMVLFKYSGFDHKHPIWVNMVQKIKIVKLNLKFGTYTNLAEFIGAVYFLFQTGNILFGQISPKKSELFI